MPGSFSVSLIGEFQVHRDKRPVELPPSCQRVIDEVSPYFNLLIRLHPFLNDIYPVETEQIYSHSSKAIFLNDFPCIYPILQITDGYIGDFSSIGYDFLAFDKPLFFLERNRGKIYNCGTQLKGHFGKTILKHKDTLSAVRRQTYHSVFGKEKLSRTRELLKELTQQKQLLLELPQSSSSR